MNDTKQYKKPSSADNLTPPLKAVERQPRMKISESEIIMSRKILTFIGQEVDKQVKDFIKRTSGKDWGTELELLWKENKKLKKKFSIAHTELLNIKKWLESEEDMKGHISILNSRLKWIEEVK